MNAVAEANPRDDGRPPRGGGCALITLTMRHHAGQGLQELWNALSYAWGRVTSGKAYLAEMELFSMTGWVRAVEVTHGEHGWHVHVHVLVTFEVGVSEETVENLAERWWRRWERALERRGISAIAHRGGLDCRRINHWEGAADGALGLYLSKVALELTSASLKEARDGNRTPFRILADGLSTGLADDLELWWTWEKASHNRRQVTWSRHVRDHYGLHREQTNEEIVDEDMGGEDTIILTAESWRVLRDDGAETLLDIVENDGLEAATRWLDARGLTWSWAKVAPLRNRRERRRRRRK